MKSEECGCGGLENIHLLGQLKCYREWVKDDECPIELPNDFWLINGQVITGCTLKEQRAYYRHENKMWSRPKSHESTNSIELD